MKVFEETVLAGIKMKNRIFRSATHEGMCDLEGSPTDKLQELFIRLAKGGVGAIITGYVSVQKNGRTLMNQRMFDDDKYINAYKKITASVQEFDTPIINQIAHGGSQTSPKITGEPVLAPSKIKNKTYNSIAREMTENEIEETISSFVDAIVRSQKSGFTGVQLHCAHGYLLSQFLSPHANKRKDKWGGSTENRFRIISEIIKKARDKVGAYPILVKFSAHDGDPKGIRIEEAKKIALLFQKSGVDAIEVSCGGISDGLNAMRVPFLPKEAILELTPWFNNASSFQKKMTSLLMPLVLKKHKPLYAYNVPASEAIKSVVDIPVISVGGLRNIDKIESVINNKSADYISMSRPFIIEPNIVNKFKEGKQNKSRCIECGYCLFGSIGNQLKCYNGKIRKK